MQRSVILSSFVLLAAGLIQFACVQDFDQFDPGKATGGAGGETATSSSSSSGTPGSGGGTSSSSSSSASSTSSSSTTSSSSSSGGMTCMKKPDCGQDDACTTWACTQGKCVATYADMTKVVSGDMDGNCKATVCNGAGATFEVNYDADTPPSDGNDCTLEKCSNGMPVKDLAQVGATCEVNRKCNMNGTCVDCIVDGDCGGLNQTCFNDGTCVSCSDNMKNGDETGVDCGGSCKKCNGTSCGNANECESGNCVDTVCCNEACDGVCKSCNLNGSAGMCSDIALNGTDNAPACNGGSVCNGAGACKLKNNETCVNDADCLSNKCVSNMGNKTCMP